MVAIAATCGDDDDEAPNEVRVSIENQNKTVVLVWHCSGLPYLTICLLHLL